MIFRLLAALARLAAARPRLLLAIAAAVSLVSLVPLARARFDTDVSRLLPQDDPRIRAFLEAKDLVAEPGALFALLEVEDGAAPAADAPARVEPLIAYADAWGAAVKAATDAAGRPIAREVELRVPERYERFIRQVLSRRGFLYLEGDALEEGLARLEDGAIRDAVREARARLSTAAPPQLARALAEDPLGLTLLFARSLGRGLGAARFDAMTGYLLSKDGRALLVRVVGSSPAGDIAYAHALMDAISRAEEAGARAAGPLLPAGARIRPSYAGGYPIALANERSIKRDIRLTFGSSFVAVIAIFVYAYRRKRALLLASVPLAAGMLWTFSLVAASGPIGVATTGFASCVIGLAVDYVIHIVSRYITLRRDGRPLEEAIEAAVASSGAGVIPAALMTIAAFLSFRATSFRALSELGTLAALGMAVCLVATFALVPPLLALTGRRADESRPLATFGLGRLWDLVCGRPRGVLAACAAITVAAPLVLALGPGPAVRLETDIRNLLPSGDRTMDAQEAIARRFGVGAESGLVLVRGRDEDEVLAALREVERALAARVESGAITGYESPARWLPPRPSQEKALARLRALDVPRIERTLRAALAESGFRVERFEASIALLRERLAPPSLVTRATLEEAGLGDLARALVPSREGAPAVGLATIMPAQGRSATEGLEETLAPVRARADVAVTSVAVVIRSLVAALERDFSLATIGAGAAVLAIALVHFRRAGPALLATLPAFVGFLWMLAAMKLLGLPVNFMNVIVFPMVIGIEDNAVHILHRYREEGAGPVRRVLDELGLALFLCTATTMLGFGSLVLSENRGLASIGAATLLGKVACWITSTVALPAWLALREERAAPPVQGT